MKKLLLLSFITLFAANGFSQTTATFNYTGSVQTFTVPSCVTSLHIVANGAQGGAVTAQNPFPQGGLGASMSGDFGVTPGDVLTIIVGGRGNSDPSSSGGGGGSGVNNGNTVLIVAGGGAGVDFQDPGYSGQNAVVTNDGVIGSGGGGAAGTGGNSGGDNIYSGTNISRGGKGWNDGNTGSTGLNGVSTNTTFTLGTWGLGGGGGSVGYGWCNCGGGGGGYSGGGSGQINASGGGGGSFNIGSNQVNTGGVNTGNGLVAITYASNGSAPSAPTSISGTSVVCNGGGTITYSIQAVATATGYTWTVPAGASIVSGQGTTSIVMQPGSTGGTVSVTADNSCGSSSATTLTLTVNSLPVVNATAASSSICAGASDVLTASGAATYSWSSGGTSATETVSPSSASTYTVTGTDANGCSSSATVSVNVNPLPSVSASASGSAICIGSSSTLTATGATSYAWSSGGTSATEIVSPISSSTYTVTGTDANGCVNTATVSVNVNQLPLVTATATDAAVCVGTPDTLMAAGASSYAWSTGGSSATEIFFPSATATYTVTGTDANGCVNTATVNVIVNQPPVVTGSAAASNVCLNDANVALTGTPVGGTWSGTGVSGNSFSPMTAGTGPHVLTYSYTDANGCSASAITTINVNACVGIMENALSSADVYPNPNNGTFSIAFNNDVNDMMIVITDLQGRQVYTSAAKTVTAGSVQQIDLANEASGMYMITLYGNGSRSTAKISVQK